MAGIFGGNLFRGMGQTSPDMTFSLTDPDVAAMQTGSPTTTTKSGAAYMPLTQVAPTPKGMPAVDQGQAYMPGPTTSSAMSPVAPPASDNTMLYVVGGVAAVGVLAVLMMTSRRGGTVKANAGKRGRRSRPRRSR